MVLKVYKTAEDVCEHLAALLSDMISGAATIAAPESSPESGAGHPGNLNIALSGGSTPKLLFRIMAEKYRDTDWSRLNFFWVDERMVPQKDEESNYGEFYRILVDGGVISETSLFPIRYDENEHLSLSETETIIREKVPFVDGFPRFDLIVLGIGEDGHTASIFPGNLQLFDTEKIVSPAIHPQSGQHRITLTGSTINNAGQVIFLCTGAGKRDILHEVIRKKNPALPATHVDPVGELIFFLDEAAAVTLFSII